MKRFPRKEFIFGSVLTLLGVLGALIFILRDPPVGGTGNGTGMVGTSWPGESGPAARSFCSAASPPASTSSPC